MIEICLGARCDRREILDYINTRMTALKICAIEVFHDDGQFVYLLLAVDAIHSVKVINNIKKYIAEYITDEYKYSYIFNKLCRLARKDSLNADYVRVLTLFDRQYEEELIASLLPRGERIFVDSFIDFRLTPLTQRWDEICNIAVKS